MAQKLFTDIPASASSIPGMVTPDISADRQPQVNWSDLAAAYALQRRMKQDREDEWARAAAINNANFAQNQRASGWNTGGSTSASTPSANQTSGMGAQYRNGGQGAVLWAPRNLQGAQLGTWASQQQNKATAENRTPPVVLQAHTGDPFSPGEVGGGGVSQSEIGRSLFGSGLTSPLGGSNPYVWNRMWANRLSGGGTTRGSAANPFPTESLTERTRSSRERPSSGAQYQYDPLYRG
jgi:hypothetical protein